MLKKRVESVEWILRLYMGESMDFTNTANGHKMKVTRNGDITFLREFDVDGTPLSMKILPKDSFWDVIHLLAEFVQQE